MDYLDHGRDMGTRLTPDKLKRAMQCAYDLHAMLAKRERGKKRRRRAR